MQTVRVLCRVITYSDTAKAVLLVRNRGESFWYAPGGEWDHADEALFACGEREVLEETGIHVKVTKLLYVQSLYIREQKRTWLEHFCYATPANSISVSAGHTDVHGKVEEARWFTKEVMQSIVCFPEKLKNEFWKNVIEMEHEHDVYIGHFEL